MNRIWGYSSAGRALEWHSRGQRFDPAYLHQESSEICGFRNFFCIFCVTLENSEKVVHNACIIAYFGGCQNEGQKPRFLHNFWPLKIFLFYSQAASVKFVRHRLTNYARRRLQSFCRKNPEGFSTVSKEAPEGVSFFNCHSSSSTVTWSVPWR